MCVIYFPRKLGSAAASGFHRVPAFYLVLQLGLSVAHGGRCSPRATLREGFPPLPDPALGLSPEGRGAVPSAGGAELEPQLNRLLTGRCLKPARVRAKPEVYCARGVRGSGRKEAPAVSLNHIHF